VTTASRVAICVLSIGQNMKAVETRQEDKSIALPTPPLYFGQDTSLEPEPGMAQGHCDLERMWVQEGASRCSGMGVPTE
jgi:hypothetical protein